MPTARITSRGRITIPKEVRERLGVEPGDTLDILVEAGHLKITPVRRQRIAEFRGLFRIERALDFGEEREVARKSRIRQLARNRQ